VQKKLTRPHKKDIKLKQQTDEKYVCTFSKVLELLDKDINQTQQLINTAIRRTEKVVKLAYEHEAKRTHTDSKYEDFKNYIIDLFVFGFTQTQIAYFVGNKITDNAVSDILKKQKVKLQPRKPINIYFIERVNNQIHTQLKYHDEKWMKDLLKQKLIFCRLNTERRIKLDKIETLENEVRK